MKKLNRLEILMIVLISVILLGTYVVSRTLAEQSGGTPDSGEDSILKETYNTLVGLSYGSETGSHGPIWNRLISSSQWVPEAGLLESDVRLGTEFYEGSRSLKTGALELLDWEKQSLLQRDNRDVTDYGETSGWDKTNLSPEVWYDKVTGLYWSNVLGSYTNDFVRATCDFYTTIPRGDYNGDDADCSNAINACAFLSLDANGDGLNNTNWYLPSQLELLQAYINGINKKTAVGWVTTNIFWSSTEHQNSSVYAWHARLDYGVSTGNTTKVVSYAVRCVLRDL